jgi:hypothetical protein
MEIWKDIPGYENYQVSNLGRIKSFWSGKEIILKNNLSRGYYIVGLYKNTKKINLKVHQLVAICFLDHIPNGHKNVIDHINGIQTDNRLENLRIITHRENISSGYSKKKTSSKYTGVSWYPGDKNWVANISINRKKINLGYFNIEEEASEAYQKALKEITKKIP